MSILCAGLGAPHAGWAAIDELARVMQRCFGAELLAPQTLSTSWIRKLSRREKLRFTPVQTSGGDVLFIVARGPEDLAIINTITDVRRKFSQIHAFITDSYFCAGFVAETALYDSITVTAHEDVAYPAQKFGIRVHQLYQGIDCLQWAPRGQFKREIDVMAFGRTPASFQVAMTHRFHTMRSPYLYLHSPLGHLAGPTVERERAMLFKLLHRSRFSLAFHLMVEPQGNRPRSMMVTSRWLESLLSGCIVVGCRPISRMADDMLNWADATVELPASPRDAVDALELLLADEDAQLEQRRINTYNTMLQHDWRSRIATLCAIQGWETTAILKDEQEDLAKQRDTWRN